MKMARVHTVTIGKYTFRLFRRKPEGYLNDFTNKIVFDWDIKITKKVKSD